MAESPSIDVELDIFSGRPNPHWLYPSETVRPLISQLRSVPANGALPIPGLGYRGFVLRNQPNSDLLPGIMRVYDGKVSLTMDGKARLIQDAIGLEQALIADATRLGFGAVIEQGRQYQFPQNQQPERSSGD
jgi:hypothetical protein